MRCASSERRPNMFRRAQRQCVLCCLLIKSVSIPCAQDGHTRSHAAVHSGERHKRLEHAACGLADGATCACIHMRCVLKSRVPQCAVVPVGDRVARDQRFPITWCMSMPSDPLPQLLGGLPITLRLFPTMCCVRVGANGSLFAMRAAHIKRESHTACAGLYVLDQGLAEALSSVATATSAACGISAAATTTSSARELLVTPASSEKYNCACPVDMRIEWTTSYITVHGCPPHRTPATTTRTHATTTVPSASTLPPPHDD